MTSNIKFDGELSYETLKEFAKYIIPFVRDFVFSEEGKRYITIWLRNHPEYEEDIFYSYDYDEDEE